MIKKILSVLIALVIFISNTPFILANNIVDNNIAVPSGAGSPSMSAPSVCNGTRVNYSYPTAGWQVNMLEYKRVSDGVSVFSITRGTTASGYTWITSPTEGWSATIGCPADIHFNAYWYYNPYLTIGVSGNGSVNVSSGYKTYNSVVSITATPQSGYYLSSWSGNLTGTANPGNLTMNGVKNVTANFSPNPWTLSVSAGTGGTVGGDSGSRTYNQSCTVTATANTGYTFVNWTSGGTPVSSSSSYTFNMPNNNYTLVANFSINSYTLSPSAGSGGTQSGSSGTITYNQSCTVNAIANTGYHFVNWTEGGSQVSASSSYTFNMPARNYTIVANFAINTWTLTRNTASATLGSVSGDSGTLNYNQSASVSATANSGYSFLNWLEGASQVSASSTYTFNMPDRNYTLVANFTTNNYTLSRSTGTNGTVSGDSGLYPYNSARSVLATPLTGYTFTNWTESGSQVSIVTNYSFTMPSRNYTIVANFRTNNYTLSRSTGTNGTVSGDSGLYPYNSARSISASPLVGYTFTNWTEGGSQVSISSTYNFSMPARNYTIVANFITNNWTLLRLPNNGGAVSGDSGTKAYNQSCSVNATANNGYTFTNWTENGSQVSVASTYNFSMPNRNYTIQANFTTNIWTLSSSINNILAGNISGDSGIKSFGTTNNVTAIANYGYRFINWTFNGIQQSTNTSYTFTMPNTNYTLIANFGTNQYQFTGNVHPVSGGNITPGNGQYPYNTTNSVQAIANSGWQLANFQGDLTGNQNPQNLVMSTDRSVTANFNPYMSVSFNIPGLSPEDPSGYKTFQISTTLQCNAISSGWNTVYSPAQTIQMDSPKNVTVQYQPYLEIVNLNPELGSNYPTSGYFSYTSNVTIYLYPSNNCKCIGFSGASVDDISAITTNVYKINMNGPKSVNIHLMKMEGVPMRIK